MGGAKKPTAANKEKSAGSKDSKRSKKDKGSEGGAKRAEITVMVNKPQAAKIIKNSKVITAPELAKQLGVKISATNKFLHESVQDGTVKLVGGYSGHWLYQPVSSSSS